MADTTALDGNDLDSVADSLVMNQQPAVEDEEEVLDADAEGQADEGEAEEDAADDEYDDEEEAEEVDEEPAEPLYTVKVKGQEKQVTLDELRRGYSGQEYVQQQMREVADSRKQVETIYHQLQQEAQQVAAIRQQLETNGVTPQPKPPSKELLQRDPIGYMEAKVQYDEDVAAWQHEQQQFSAVNARQEAMQRQAMQYTLEQERQKLIQAIPEFGDPEIGPRLKQQIIDAGQNQYGFTADELTKLVDSRAVKVLKDAMEYKKILASRGEVQKRVEKARPVVKPGAKRPATAGKAQAKQKAAARMQKTGSVDDVANFLLS